LSETQTISSPAEVVAFWREAGPARWFERNEAFDRTCRMRFHDAHFAAARREYEHWMHTAEGALALLILLDQIPRNLFRGSAHAFATDPLAHHYATRALGLGFDQQLEEALRPFFYLPFQHAENPVDQQHALNLFGALSAPGADRWARHHQQIIERFGRFPHRNAALGRATTPSEQAFLDNGGFKG
jgi:uncharacterized protein (DUF924 family)